MTTIDTNIDPDLIKNGDKRNVVDKYRYWSNDAIKSDMIKNSTELHIAIENLAHDFNMGTIVRNANAFCVRAVHIIGRKQWNKRGAMVTNRYLDIIYHPTVDDFLKNTPDDYNLIAIDNQADAKNLTESGLPLKSILIFGSESDGISPQLLAKCQKQIQIEQLGSTRSVNVGVASGIAMYEWTRLHKFSKKC